MFNSTSLPSLRQPPLPLPGPLLKPLDCPLQPPQLLIYLGFWLSSAWRLLLINSLHFSQSSGSSSPLMILIFYLDLYRLICCCLTSAFVLPESLPDNYIFPVRWTPRPFWRRDNGFRRRACLPKLPTTCTEREAPNVDSCSGLD